MSKPAAPKSKLPDVGKTSVGATTPRWALAWSPDHELARAGLAALVDALPGMTARDARSIAVLVGTALDRLERRRNHRRETP
jgi:hypothetical protein